MAWTEVQNSATQTLGTGAGNGGTSLAVTLAGVTAGNLLVVYFTTWAAGNVGSGAVTASGWDASIPQASNGTSLARDGMLFLKNAPSGSNTVTLSWATAADCAAYIVEYNDSQGSNPTLDGTSTNVGAGSPQSTGNSTNTVGDLITAVIGDGGDGQTYSVSDSKTSVGGNNGSATVPTVFADYLLSATGTTNSGAWTTPGNSNWSAVVAGFKATPAAAGGPLPQRGPGPRYRVPVTGQVPLPFVPVVVVPAGQPLLTLQGVKGPRHSRFPFTGQVPLGGPFQAAAADSATATDGASVQQFPDVGYHPPVLGPRQRWPITGQVPLAGPAVVVSDTASAADGASVVQFPDAGYRSPQPGPKFRIPILGQVPLTAGGGPVAVSANDTASGADAVTLIGVTDPADTGAGADGVTGVGLTSVDVGAGAEGVSSIGLTGADPGTGADGVGSVGLNTTDAGTGGDGASVVDLGGGAVSVIVRQGVRGPKFFLALRAQVPFGAPSAPLVVGPLEYVQGRRPGSTTKDLRPPTTTKDRRALATVSGQRPPTTTKDRRPDPAKTSQRRAR